jgi:demethylmenaquinone methyltransferase/2-methoxy-6-polyprenyl-1,4-benzoquinol methylase
MEDSILHEQIAYYRARAQEYDEVVEGSEDLKGVVTKARELLQQKGPFEHVLELACGTGIWTQTLLAIASNVTAVDAAPEMLIIAQQKLAGAPIFYLHKDLFQWEPEQEYDLVFFANWLSHIPPQQLDAFLTKVAHAVCPGGYLIIIDQYAPTPEDRAIMKEGEGGNIYAQRSLRNGESFSIVKVFYDMAALQKTLVHLGFEVVIHKVSEIFFFLEAQRHI